MIVTISRQMGSEGDLVAARVATELGLLLVDRAYVREAARIAGVPDELLKRLTYEGQRGMAAEIMDTLGAQRTPDRVSAPSASPLLNVFAPMFAPASMSLEDAAQAVGLVIKHVAERSPVLILGQAGQVLLRDWPEACHVQIVAPLDLRVARVSQREKITASQARRRVRTIDDARATYLARYFDARWQNPLLYHLVINTGQTPPDAAISLIVHAARLCAPAATGVIAK